MVINCIRDENDGDPSSYLLLKTIALQVLITMLNKGNLETLGYSFKVR